MEVNKPVLQDISLHVPAGSILAIVGPTGSGKSTLAALIARLWDAPPGTLLIDGRPIREWPLETLRRAVGYVPQDTFLFSETLRENIAFGVDEATDQQIRGCRRGRQHRRGNRRVPRQIRNDGRRARNHALRRPEAARRHCPRRDSRSQDSDSGRFPFQRGYGNGRTNPAPPGRDPAATDDDADFPPRFDRATRRPDRGAARGANRRARNACGTFGARRLLRRPVSTSNCSKKSWNANERLPRRGSPRKGLRRAAFAAADDLFAAVSLERRLRGHIDVTGRPARGGGPLPVRIWQWTSTSFPA